MVELYISFSAFGLPSLPVSHYEPLLHPSSDAFALHVQLALIPCKAGLDLFFSSSRITRFLFLLLDWPLFSVADVLFCLWILLHSVDFILLWFDAVR